METVNRKEVPATEAIPDELARLSTFARCEIEIKKSPITLARAGFVITDEGKVGCTSCSIILDPRTSESPLKLHLQNSPSCEIAVRCQLYSGHSTDVNRDEVSVPIDREKPDYERLKTESVRLSTFHDWPTRAYADPVELVKEGFFYTGNGDRVCCAFCRGFLRNWLPEDRPDEEHKKHFPDCPFVRRTNIDRPTDSEKFCLEGPELEKENIRLKDATTCKVCMNEQLDTVFLPCGHLTCCEGCSSKVRHCPICRKFIKATVKAFLS
jgi:hypothetical protein